jgi:hypothetical protein
MFNIINISGTTVFEKEYICYYRFVVNFSVNYLVALLASNIMIQQPKQHWTGATSFSIFVTPIISKINNHGQLSIFVFNVVEILDNIIVPDTCKLKSLRISVYMEIIHLCSYFHTFPHT